MVDYKDGFWEESSLDLEDPDDMTEEEWEEYMDYLYSLIKGEFEND